MRRASGRIDAAVNAALVALGLLAVVDNVVFHWILAFHRFKDGWPGSIYVELLLVAAGLAMIVVGIVREWHARNSSDPH